MSLENLYEYGSKLLMTYFMSCGFKVKTDYHIAGNIDVEFNLTV